VQFRKFDDQNQPTSKRPSAQDIPKYAENEICPRKLSPTSNLHFFKSGAEKPIVAPFWPLSTGSLSSKHPQICRKQNLPTKNESLLPLPPSKSPNMHFQKFAHEKQRSEAQPQASVPNPKNNCGKCNSWCRKTNPRKSLPSPKSKSSNKSKICPQKTNSLNGYTCPACPSSLIIHHSSFIISPHPPESIPTKKPHIPRENGMPLSSTLKKMQYSSSSQGESNPQHSRNHVKHATKITPRYHGIKH
jgi:hypothetical protein